MINRANAQRDSLPIPINAYDVEIATDLHEQIAQPDAWAHKALVGRYMAGVTLSYPASETDNCSYGSGFEYLSHLMVDPCFWGRGIASTLVDLTSEHARANGKQQVVLWTRESHNERARVFYAHKGFQLTEAKRISSKRGPQVQYLLDL